MNFLLLGYLYFYIVINPVHSSDYSHISIEITKQDDIENCTQCSFKPEASCKCWQHFDKCLICCSDCCCICDDCILCGNNQRDMQVLTQVIVSVLLAFGIIGLMLIYCKMCHRTRRLERRRCIVLQQEHDATMNCNTIEGLRERPPPYNEMIRGIPSVYTSSYNAPPLYTSPYNRISMQEPPPSYSGTPKLQETSQVHNESSSIVQHI